MSKANIFIASDFQPNDALNVYVQKKEDKAFEMFGYLNEHIKKADISLVNIEYPITNQTISIPKYGPILKGEPECLKPLSQAGFNIATLANNHIYNYKNAGVKDTIHYCTKFGFKTVGAGTNEHKARRVLYNEIGGYIIAILNFAEKEFNYAQDEKGGANALDVINNVQDIKGAKKHADFIVVIIHGGSDFSHFATSQMRKQYRFYASIGVNAIIGHHSHVIAGYEVFKGVPIFYGLGNFVHAAHGFADNYYIGFALNLNFGSKGVDYEILPYRFDPEKIKIERLEDDDEKLFKLQLKNLNYALTLDEKEYERVWGEDVLNTQDIVYLTILNSIPRVIYKIFRKLKMLKLLKHILLVNKKRFYFTWNILRCERHRESIDIIFKDLFNYDKII